MVEQVRVTGGVPPMPAGGYERQNRDQPPPASEQTPGFVAPPAPAPAPAEVPAQFSPEQLAAAAAYLQAQQAQPAPAPAQPPASPVPAATLNLNEVQIDDPTLAAKARLFRGVAPDVDVDRAIGLAISRGDASLIDEKYLKEVAGDKAADLLVLAKDILSTVEANAVAGTQAAYAAAGGEAQWNTAAAVFSQKAPQHLKDYAESLLQSSSVEKMRTLAAVVVDFAKQQGAVTQPAQLFQTGAPAGVTANGIGSEAFKDELRKLNVNSPDFAQKRNALIERRAIGKAAGLQ